MSDVPRLIEGDLTVVLADGRSPACWQRQLAQTVDKSEKVTRACSWLDDIIHQRPPTLHTGSLLGDCLDQLLDYADEGAISPGDDTRLGSGINKPVTHKPRHRRISEWPWREVGNDKSVRKADTVAVEPSDQPAQAKRSLLTRLAGETAVAQSQPSTAQNKFARPKKPLPGVINQSLPISTSAVDPLIDQVDPRGLSERLAKRTRQRHLTKPDPGRTMGNLEVKDLRAEKGNLSWSEVRPSGLETQWRQSLFGQVAPAAILAALNAPSFKQSTDDASGSESQRPILDDGRVDRTGDFIRRPQADKARNSRLQHHTLSRSVSTEENASKNPSTRPDISRSKPEQQIQPEQQHQPERQNKSLGVESSATTTTHPAADQDNGEQTRSTNGQSREMTPPRFAPPQLAPTLADLHPPRPATAVNPVASDTAKRSGRREAVDAGETLDDLAYKIKQILDEESRRHGIDV